MPKKPTRIYQIKVTLNGAHPPIWRRILVPDNTTLLKLHDILQIVMGWEDAHLHMYTIGDEEYGNPEDDEFGDLGTLDESRYTLRQVIHAEGQRFTYEYDFGDSWEHTLLVEKILPPEEGLHYPLCLKGKRACPPEDVGGVWGYENFLEAIGDPRHEQHEDYLDWYGEEFDPEAFDLEEINAQLRSMGRGRSVKALDAWDSEDDMPLDVIRYPSSSPWPHTLPGDQQAVAEALPLRRDVIALLAYLRDNKVTGTQSTGNLPLKAVHEICALFVHPPVLDETVGEHVFRVRSESEVWPLYFRHVLASIAGLVDGGMSRRWMLTPLGERFLEAHPPLQVWILFATWWAQINWAIAFPYQLPGDSMPPGFSTLALQFLLDLPEEDPVAFVSFADRLTEASGLGRPFQGHEFATDITRNIVERTLIHPLVDFGILQIKYEPHKTLGPEFRELYTFQITPLGRGLLEAIHAAMK